MCEFERFVTDVLEGQRGPGCDLNGIASVREGRDAARRAGNHVYPDQGLLVFCGGYDTANGDQIPPPLDGAATDSAHMESARRVSRIVFCIRKLTFLRRKRTKLNFTNKMFFNIGL